MQEIDTTGLSDSRWMSLIEAVKYIESVLGVSSVSAQVALKKKIGRGKLPVKWADAAKPADTPNVGELALSQLVLSTPGLAPDGVSLRPLLVLRSAVLAAWRQEENEIDSISETPQVGPYQTAQWMSLVEAVEHIRMVEDCDSIEALRQLKTEIGDGMVRVQWKDSQGSKDCPDPKYLRASQLLLIGTGIALDSVKEIYRSLLVERFAMRELWPLSNHRRKESPRTDSGSTTSSGKLPRRSVDDDAILSAARNIYRISENNPPNLLDAEQLIRQKLPGAKRDHIRRILKEEEFANLRNPPGNQRRS